MCLKFYSNSTLLHVACKMAHFLPKGMNEVLESSGKEETYWGEWFWRRFINFHVFRLWRGLPLAFLKSHIIRTKPQRLKSHIITHRSDWRPQIPHHRNWKSERLKSHITGFEIIWDWNRTSQIQITQHKDWNHTPNTQITQGLKSHIRWTETAHHGD